MRKVYRESKIVHYIAALVTEKRIQASSDQLRCCGTWLETIRNESVDFVQDLSGHLIFCSGILFLAGLIMPPQLLGQCLDFLNVISATIAHLNLCNGRHKEHLSDY